MDKRESKFQQFKPGEVLFREGDTSRDMYIIRSGRVRITISKGGKEIPITELGKGSFVGEMSLISGIPRTASVIAVERVYANVISREVFENSRFGIPDWIQSIAQTLVERIRHTTIMLSDYIAVGDVPALEDQKVEDVPDTLTIQEDTEENRVVLKGYFCGKHINDVKELVRKTVSKNSSVVTIDFSGVIDIDKDVLNYLKELINSPAAQKEKIRFTNVQLIYNKLSELKGVTSLIDSYKMQIRSVAKGEFLIHEGELARSMYIVRTGKFEIFREKEEAVPLPSIVLPRPVM
ncbi:MAG: cyclic nucleotide-binding domain-containing protein [Spirochaetia bacterium]|nr:cyclic nucleotide-binding domain-containing protein [Spirochaetia bacterium]